MDKDRIEGKTNDVAGRIKRQVGEWTGDENLQSEGALGQAKGKVQNTWGKVKDAARDASEDLKNRDHPEREEDVA
ncbi:MAG TPA: CsbD family protein [Terriglobales bacterium]|nr:CsbD family protein [Terriglobales bacterium]